MQSKAEKEIVKGEIKENFQEITQEDHDIFFKVVSFELTPEQKKKIACPDRQFPRQKSVLAVHWHPEFIPMELISQRIDTLYPHRENELIIPTQHNEIMEYKGFAGVEVDCYSKGFNQKVQILLHFKDTNVKKAHTLKKMLAHTFKYRSSQLFDFMDTIIRPHTRRIETAAGQTGADPELIEFVRIHVKKIETLIDQHSSSLPPQVMKNKVLRNFFDCLRPQYGDPFINRIQTYLTAVKKIVKADFPLKYFFRTSEIIEEARSLNAGIVIPHPEQFWPVLLAGYDVDGVEVWNPQSHRYTDFLISVLQDMNAKNEKYQRKLLILMGDDTHFGEKIKDSNSRNGGKPQREIGVQPSWDDLEIGKKLIKGNVSRERVIQEYKHRLSI
ncbi:hypothetical protein [Desulfocicer vacuolatum]|uniref:hypothetical protein n=1 Tax=Desulfocicer vacuolatum TaxID=2298 RepID=UPI001E42030B|nr:hypothetical protein [Desulfocicer vacuolatum]